MPQIARVVSAFAPLKVSWQRRAYDSPRDAWTLVLRDPREWHMGADGWKAELWSATRNVSWKHKRILKIAGAKGFRAPTDYQPWACDDRTVAFVTWDEGSPIYLYSVETRSIRQATFGRAFPCSVQWSRDADRLLLSFENCGYLYNSTGQHQGTAQWTIAPEGSFHTDWTRWGMFFRIARDPAQARSRLTFYEGAAGRLVNTVDLDPLDLVPYDDHAYSAVVRNGYTLITSKGIRGAGFLLDSWHTVRFDPNTDELLLGTYRPTSPAYLEAGHVVCKVAEEWVAVTLAA